MILYSTTYNVEKEIYQEFLSWMRQFVVEDLKNSGLLKEYKILRLLTEIDDQGITFSFQFYLNNMQDYLKLENQFSEHHQREVRRRFLDKCVSFSTILEVLDL